MPAATGEPPCLPAGGGGTVQPPVFVRNHSGQTSWFASPIVTDLDGDGSNELVVATYDVSVYSSAGALLDVRRRRHGPRLRPARRRRPRRRRHDRGRGRARPPGDRLRVVQVRRSHSRRAGRPTPRPAGTRPRCAAWPPPTSTATARSRSSSPRRRPCRPTTAAPRSSSSAPDGISYQPAGGLVPAWPRYNNLPGPGNDADRNGPGHHGYGCYGLNVGIGNIDDDPAQEILVTYDNHSHPGVRPRRRGDRRLALLHEPRRTVGRQRLTWGQFIRWADAQVEADHYHLHAGEWPHPDWTEWLQWTASPPNVVDLDRGRQKRGGRPCRTSR